VDDDDDDDVDDYDNVDDDDVDDDDDDVGATPENVTSRLTRNVKTAEGQSPFQHHLLYRQRDVCKNNRISIWN